MSEIKYPITVQKIEFKVEEPIHAKGFGSAKPGEFVAVRSCKKEHGDKTRLGLMLGFVPIHNAAVWDEKTGTLTFEHFGGNPAMFVFDLNEVVLGCGSWWGKIKDENHLKEITNDDINNVWYVKALKQLAERKV